jgi:hypothetical protein
MASMKQPRNDDEDIRSAIDQWLRWKSGARRVNMDGEEVWHTPYPKNRDEEMTQDQWAAYWYRCLPPEDWEPGMAIREPLIIELPAALRSDIEAGHVPCPPHLVERTFETLTNMLKGN